MNNLKKVSLSALAGSLAMVSAQAGDFTVTGGAEMTYLSTSENQGSTGNPFGMSHNIDLTGSGEVNGIGWTVYTGTTGQSLAGDSSSLVFDLGDMGTVSFDQGVGINGIGTLANNTPTAYEEADHNTSVLGDGLDVTGDTGTIGYATTFAGLGIDIEYNPSHANATKATAGSGTGASSGSNLNYALTYEVMSGLTMGFGASKTEYTSASALDDAEWTVSANYAIDRFKVGYQQSEITTAGAMTGRVVAYSVAANVNESLSVSYGVSDHEKSSTSSAHITEENTGVNAAYTMGSAAVRLSANTTDNAGGIQADNREAIELSLNLSF
jgi:outer membrane protein OmpU